MTADRAAAYARFVGMLDGPTTTLLRAEVGALREAADILIFAKAVDNGVVAAMITVLRLARDLVDTGRWTEENGALLVEEAAACAPPADKSRDLALATRVPRASE
jgi:hypothetical protein